MNLLKERILADGKVLNGSILKVDSFLNHQIDVNLLNEIGKEFKSIFGSQKVTKILTVESSGIAVACITAQHFGVPVVFAKKASSKNMDLDIYTSVVHSYTRDTTYTMNVSKRFLNESDRILIIDDFLANGNAVLGLNDIIQQSNALLIGVGIVIEKGFQNGGDLLRNQGINVKSLARIHSMHNGILVFE